MHGAEYAIIRNLIEPIDNLMNTLIKKKFYFLRHGKTNWNEKQLCQGHLDIPLNQAGREEVSLVCPLIKTLPIAAIVTSPLSRAFESAQIIQNTYEIPLEIVDDLKERGWGQKEGISSQEMYRIEMEEEAYAAYDPGCGIEPRNQFKLRIISGINKALQYENPLIVSHGRLFLCLSEIMGLPPVRHIPNATVIECTPSQDNWTLTYHTPLQ